VTKLKKSILQITKAVAMSVIVALALVLIFTFIIQIFSLPSSVIKPVNQVIKILCIVAGGLIFIRDEGGLVKGGIYGALAVIVTYLLFAIIAGEFAFSWTTIVEFIFGSIIGGIVGVIAVNIKK
jgi:putative membrane protein (TIGR04086 family)